MLEDQFYSWRRIRHAGRGRGRGRGDLHWYARHGRCSKSSPYKSPSAFSLFHLTTLSICFVTIWLLALYIFLCACFLCYDQVCLWFFPVCLICRLVPSSACSDYIDAYCLIVLSSVICFILFCHSFVIFSFRSAICYLIYLIFHLLFVLFDLSHLPCLTICSYSFICSFSSYVWLLTLTCLD